MTMAMAQRATGDEVDDDGVDDDDGDGQRR